jgi:ABC-type nitrate/sulfonate/bicarbonate transport system permease component
MKGALALVLPGCTVLVLWQAVVMAGMIPGRFLPPPSDVLITLARLLATADVLTAIGTTFLEVLLAGIIAIPVGILLGLMVAENKLAYRLLGPALSALMVLPKSVFLPLFILALGVGVNQKVVFGIFQACFVIAVTTTAAVQGIPTGLLLVGRAQRAGRLQMYRHIYLPYMLPVVLQGVRLGVVYAVHGILFAEMYVSRVGLGRLVQMWGNAGQAADMLAAAALAGLLAIAVNEALRLYERRAGVWRT